MNIIMLLIGIFIFLICLCANGDTPLGFRPTDHMYGCHPYNVSSGYATKIHEGEPIKPVTGGYVERAATTEALILGVAANAIEADTGGVLWVYDHPVQHFVCQDDASATLDVTIQNACMDSSTDGDTNGDQSDCELIATAITGADGQWRILYPAKTRYPDGVENALGDNCDWICIPNQHVYKNETGI